MRAPDWVIEILPQILEINRQMINFNSGLGRRFLVFIKKSKKKNSHFFWGLTKLFGVDFDFEIGKMFGGGLLWDLIRRMSAKLDCLEARQRGDKPTELCRWINPLKYYVHSAVRSFILEIEFQQVRLFIVARHDNRRAFRRVQFQSDGLWSGRFSRLHVRDSCRTLA